MLGLNKLKVLTIGDVRNIKRDSMLGWFVALPVIMALAIRWGVPKLNDWLITAYSFDLTPYYPPILGYAVLLMAPVLIGATIGFLLLDEQDDDTLTALRVTPLSLESYLWYRIGMPVLITFMLMLLLFPLIKLVTLPPDALIATAVLSALTTPLVGLAMATFADNKVTGFALVKGGGFLLIIPLVVFFVDTWWNWLAAFIPTFYPMKIVQLATAGENYGLYFAVGLVYHLILIALLVRKFRQKIIR